MRDVAGGGSLTTCPGRSPGPSSGMAGPLFSASLPQEVPEEGVEEVKQPHGRCFPITRRRLVLWPSLSPGLEDVLGDGLGIGVAIEFGGGIVSLASG